MTVTRARLNRAERARTLRANAPRARRVTRAGDHYLHVHFAAAASLDAMRIGRLVGLPFSITAHAHEIFRSPANLELKLAAAAFTAGESQYATRHLREIAGPRHADRVHFLPAGVELERFRRARPYPGGRTVVAVGRLVEKKGFAYLVEAAALMAEHAEPVEVLIAGDGSLHEPLLRQISERGVEDRVRLLGAQDHDRVRELLEDADVLAMPCVVAADGDRDSMPNVVYEALAMEVPVVGSDMVGLPEVIAPEWGRLARPGDPEALATAIGELLALPAGERAAMGRAGRAWVERERDMDVQAERLVQLIRAPDGRQEREPLVAPLGQSTSVR